ncbi:MAG TPA: type I methionyl aminopeptidase [Actinomycetota bacterium]|nr:type I methionyl aminopeptidase [Actinomycetota bacterium]
MLEPAGQYRRRPAIARLRGTAPCWCGSGRKFKKCHGDHRAMRRPQVRPGRVSPMLDVPSEIDRPPYALGSLPVSSTSFQLHSGESLDRLRAACRVAAEVLETVGEHVRPGVTTDELDRVAHEAYVSRGAYPSTLSYKGYPKSICTSVNEVVCHGIPDDRPLEEGDIVNVDVTAYLNGMHGDTSATFPVGQVDKTLQALIEVTREATLRGIAAVAPGRPLNSIGNAIQPFAAARGYGVVVDYGGHGIGSVFHAAPHVNHTVHDWDTVEFEPGMTFTVEPMITGGSPNHHMWSDGWTVATNDLLPTAQFEHTVIVTDTGVEILTLTARGTSPAGTLEMVAEPAAS